MNLSLRSVTVPVVDVEFLASAKNQVTKGVTLDASTFTADGNGNKIVKAGTVLGKITASGLYGPYADAAVDGRTLAELILLNTINVRDGNAAVAALSQGVVLEARLTGLDANAKTDLTNRFEFR